MTALQRFDSSVIGSSMARSRTSRKESATSANAIIKSNRIYTMAHIALLLLVVIDPRHDIHFIFFFCFTQLFISVSLSCSLSFVRLFSFMFLSRCLYSAAFHSLLFIELLLGCPVQPSQSISALLALVNSLEFQSVITVRFSRCTLFVINNIKSFLRISISVESAGENGKR